MSVAENKIEIKYKLYLLHDDSRGILTILITSSTAVRNDPGVINKGTKRGELQRRPRIVPVVSRLFAPDRTGPDLPLFGCYTSLSTEIYATTFYSYIK